MSNEQQERPGISTAPHLVTIVASCYNERYTNALVENCVAELAEILPQGKVQIVRVPGAFEIPVTVKSIAVGAGDVAVPSVIIALGVIIQGRTEHANLVGTSVTDALMNIALSARIPVIHEVLLLDDEEQAEERCIKERKNRGREAACSAVKMADLFASQFTSLQI